MSRLGFPRRYLVPNAITATNIALGLFAVLAAAAERHVAAVWLIFAAMICDMLDGKAARLLRAGSPFGLQFDSLSDMISFGVAPAILVYMSSLHELGLPAGGAIIVFYVLCGALRLARFNIDTSEAARRTFFGAPIPVAASYMTAWTMLGEHMGPHWVAAGTVTMALLMVSRIKVPNFKGSSLPPLLLYLGIAPYVVFLALPGWITFWVWTAYAFFLLFMNYRHLGRPAPAPAAAPPGDEGDPEEALAEEEAGEQAAPRLG